MILDEKTANDLMKNSMEHARADEIMDKLIQDSEFRAMLEHKLEKLTRREDRAGVSC